MAAEAVVAEQIAEEDVLRAHVYRLLAKFLRAAPDQTALDSAAGISGDDSELGQALGVLAKLAGRVLPKACAEEYQNLFIGVGRGELVPYASYYLTGFLNEKPLAKLRNDMRRLGIERRDAVREPEDHIAALCEMMCGLILGDFGEPLDLAAQKTFYYSHVASWASHFFGDLEQARSSTFYGAVGSVGKAFIGIEDAAFEMVKA
jgi:TorA maturation chaperone TorD